MERRAIAIRGTVQGVGFRPFVYSLASRLDLHGFVRNQTSGVEIEVEGESSALDQFLSRLKADPPPLAHIDALSWQRQAPRGEKSFRIEASESDAGGAVVVSPDQATCADCLAELFDPNDRRYRYPFLNCTNCGPRLTIIQGAPYDRARTTMAAFPMCPACQAEYDDPANRRFHAQPTACAVCGPSLDLLDASGARLSDRAPLAGFVAAIRAGRIGALKGLGGYHLVCAATNREAVAELRRRKHRDEKPFAIMVRDIAGAEAASVLAPKERTLLLSSRRPIVLLRKSGQRDVSSMSKASPYIAEEVAPQNPFLGVMLPYTPLHHLLLHDLDGLPLVMTSGNRSDEPIAFDDAEALARLAGIADVFLIHNRPIHVRCDDSVTRVVDNEESPMRRSRGYAPQPISSPTACKEPMLAVGGQFKGVFALGRQGQAILSQHMGDLDHFDAFRAFERDILLYQDLFQVIPRVLVHDLHPDYASTRYALDRGTREGIACMGVQHHHAHMASCMAENGLSGPVIGVCFDGTGFGTDGAIWGGEFLVGSYESFRRAAHLRYVGMPGGDRAVREPWRMALAHLVDAGCGTRQLESRQITPLEIRTAKTMLARGFNTPRTSSAGRLFDAVAALAGVGERVSFEGQAAIRLEWLALDEAPAGTYPFGITAVEEDGDETLVIDTRPLIAAVDRDVAEGVPGTRIARILHSAVAELIAEVCCRLRAATGLGEVVFSGGVFLNALLSSEAGRSLGTKGFRVYQQRLVPPNDGGLSLGQIAVAAARLANARA